MEKEDIFNSSKRTYKKPDKTVMMTATIPAQSDVGVAVPVRKANRKTGIIILSLCFAVAVAVVAITPMVVGGAAISGNTSPAVSAAALRAEITPQEAVEYNTIEEAVSAVGYSATLPEALPEGAQVSKISVINGKVLEVVYNAGKVDYTFRMAPGKDDPSGDVDEYIYSICDTVDGVTRRYSGVGEDKLSLAVWVQGDYAYSVKSSANVNAQTIKTMVESI